MLQKLWFHVKDVWYAHLRQTDIENQWPIYKEQASYNGEPEDKARTEFALYVLGEPAWCFIPEERRQAIIRGLK